MNDFKILEEINGFRDVPMSAWSIALRLMILRQKANQGSTDPYKSRGLVRDMRCHLLGLFSEVMVLFHLHERGASSHAIEYAQKNLYYPDIGKHSSEKGDFFLKGADKDIYVDAKSYAVMRPYQEHTINVNVEKTNKLTMAGCEHLIFCFARPFSRICYFTKCVPIEGLSKSKQWDYIKMPQRFNDYYAIKPNDFLKYSASRMERLYCVHQHNIVDVESLAWDSAEFHTAVSRRFPHIRWFK